ncbi:hypothetical protein [Streptomyces sp. NPDC053048]|uniref:hypothetical protein n=1 Tax=Streptomyces sp. NPDC053048 TaxID=3365694 RepID=UPI0037D764BB
MSIALAAAAAAVCATVTSTAAAQSAVPEHRAQVRVPGPGDQPPFRYADCVKLAVEQRHESPSYAKWHCDQLVKKGWVKPPKA